MTLYLTVWFFVSLSPFLCRAGVISLRALKVRPEPRRAEAEGMTFRRVGRTGNSHAFFQ